MDDSLLDAAWRGVRRAREHDWSRSTVARIDTGVGAIEVRRGGDWSADAVWPAGACALLDSLLPLVARCGGLAIAQLGQSLDGRIATESGASHYINGLASRVHLHRLRALVDAVLVGAGTVAADDPQLTVRHVEGANPWRVVCDPRGRLDVRRDVFQTAAAPTLHLVGRGAPPLVGAGAHVERLELPAGPRGIEPRAVLDALAERGLTRVLVEGGGVTVSRFVEADVLHRLHLLVAPLLIGSGRPGLALTPIDTLDAARRPPARTFPCGDDTLFDLRLLDP
ncbi:MULTISPECIES: RibD family protein [unclassified Modicisalibacter]|uniref:RibD family protein n=1 Tax=unclassified Modicisalibacter TaxID=2679913 RepID=UPI001CCDB657|nr:MULTISPECIES: RibD family protein [unclassified Modicisalibacter]MBZ9560271.1 RibD family protein [Modicisalibacter sp. R2A 31.J]MBZ9576180.1 RibD family protein [Modicisalibacter sp. MOD 31.J]